MIPKVLERIQATDLAQRDRDLDFMDRNHPDEIEMAVSVSANFGR
jgi:hypothetical protein